MNMYWADLHNHNEVGYGKGSLERSYALAENSLDVYAFSPHGYWPDPPASDPKLVRYHVEHLDRISAAFPRVVETANARYRPGRFVAFIAYEWHSTGWGDYVVLFPGSEGELYRARDLDDLKGFARRRGALLIPHHVAYRRGWRGLDWSALDPELSPLVEVFSEHGNSLERDGLWPMLPHSMGGACRSQTVLEQLRLGRHIGFTAGTDDHYGYPACYGEGITGIEAPELTREAVFEALRRRHTCAATGDRTDIRVRSGDATMGDALPADAPRRFEIDVQPLAPLDYVQVLRNGEPAQMWPGPARSRSPIGGRAIVRVEWGWGRMGHPEPTDWTVAVDLVGGRIQRLISCFAGGAGSTERDDAAVLESPTRARVKSFTSRLNALPVSGVVLVIEGTPATRLQVGASARNPEEQGECRVDVSLSDLAQDDAWASPLQRFSSPRLRVGNAHGAEQLAFRTRWEDPAPAGRDTYVIKAQQANGQCAWTSPLLFG